MNKKLIVIGITLVFILMTAYQISADEDKLSIIFGEAEYNQGDIVSVTLFCDSEKTVEEFYVDVYYGSSGVDTVENFDGVYYPAIGNSASFSFRAARSNTLVTVEVVAYDDYHDEGGYPLAYEESQVYVGDPEPGSYTDDSDDPNTNGDKNQSTPGFELSLLICLIAIITILKKKSNNI